MQREEKEKKTHSMISDLRKGNCIVGETASRWFSHRHHGVVALAIHMYTIYIFLFFVNCVKVDGRHTHTHTHTRQAHTYTHTQLHVIRFATVAHCACSYI